MNKPLLTWASPIQLDPLEGLVLALCLRLCASKRTLPDGRIEYRTREKRLDPLPTTLTKERIGGVLVSYAFLRHKIRTTYDILSEDDVLKLIAGLKENDVKGWAESHQQQLTQTLQDLEMLAAGAGSLGFRCVG